MKLTYKIKEKKEDINTSIIEKSGHTIEFTLDDVKKTQDYNRKSLKELNAFLEVNNVKLKNIEEHHKEVLDLTEEQLFTYAMYQNLKTEVANAEEKKVLFENAIKNIDEEVEDVLKQLPELKVEVVEEEKKDDNQ